MKYKSVSFNIIFTLLFLIFSGMFLIYIFWNIQNREDFTGDSGYSWKYGEGNGCDGDLNTNTEIMKRNSYFLTRNYNRFDNNRFYNQANLRNASHPYRNYCDVMTFKELLAYRCLNKSPMELQTILESAAVDIASTIDYVYIYNDISLKSFILSKILTKKNTLETKVVGPVYVCISQAPYLRSVSNKAGVNPLNEWNDAREDTSNPKYSYYYENISSAGVRTATTATSDGTDTFANTQIISSLYCHILIVYPAYTRAMTLKEPTIKKQPAIIKNFLEKTMAPYYTDHGLCFLKCNKATDLNCGCLTRTASVSQTSPAATGNPYYEGLAAAAARAATAAIDAATAAAAAATAAAAIDATAATIAGAATAANTASAASAASAAATATADTNDARDKPLYESTCKDHTKNNAVSNFTMMYFVNPYSAEYGDNGIIKNPEEDFPDEKCDSA